MRLNLAPLMVGLTSALLLSSCGDPDPSKAPVRHTPEGDKVDLSQVSLSLANVQVVFNSSTKPGAAMHLLKFDYTVTNSAGVNIAFPCLYNELDDLIEVNLHDKEGNPVNLGKRPLEGLTLAEPRTLNIPVGITTRSYQVPLMPNTFTKDDTIKVRVRLHAPSRYDELRSSLEAPSITIPWPAN